MDKDKMIERDKVNVLIEAIKDNQNIIRRMDTKARFYLAIYLALIAGLGKITFFILEKINFIHKEVIKNIFIIFVIVLITLIGFYIFLIIETIKKVTSPQIHPTENIQNLPQEHNIFFPISNNQNKIDFNLYKNLLYQIKDYEDLQNTLLTELLIVSIIRDIKVKNMKKIEKRLIYSLYLVITIILSLTILRIIFIA